MQAVPAFSNTAVGSSSGATTVTFNFAGTLASPAYAVLTKGVPNLDFQDAGGGTCAPGATSSCTVNVVFKPKVTGARSGAVVLYDNTGNVAATAYVIGRGTGPQAVLTPGTITTVAGNGIKATTGNGGPATSASIDTATVTVVDGAGSVYIGTYNSNTCQVRKVDASTGVISAYAGSGTCVSSGDGGLATSAQMSNPYALAIDGAGNLYIGDYNVWRIRRVDAHTGIITTYAGNGTQASPGCGVCGDGGLATSAQIFSTQTLAVDGAGNLYIGDIGINRVRKVDAVTKIITNVAGVGDVFQSGAYTPDGGPAVNAHFDSTWGIAVDVAGNVFIAEAFNQVIRRVDAVTGVLTTVAGTPKSPGFSGDGGAATSAMLNRPQGIAVDAAGDLYIMDGLNHRVRRVDAATGIITTVAGNGNTAFNGDNIAATAAAINPNNSTGMSVDGKGNLYIPDSLNQRIRKVDVSQVGALTFLPQYVGQTSIDSPLKLQMTDIGTDPLNLLDAGSLPVGSFQIDSARPQACAIGALTSGNSCFVYVDFNPTLVGSNAGAFNLISNSLNQSPATQTINVNGTGVQITISPSPSIPNGTVASPYAQTLTASGGAAGPYAFAVTGGTLPPGLTLSSAGVLSGAPTTAGSYTFTVTATDSSSFNGTNGATGAAVTAGPFMGQQVYTLTISPATPAVTLSSSPNPSAPGQPVTFTATLPTGATGAISFQDNGVPIAGCNPVTVSTGPPPTATCTTSALAVGTHPITAAYSGGSNFGPATSNQINQAVKATSSTTTLTVNPATVMYGVTSTLKAVVTPVGATGTVTFTAMPSGGGSPVTLGTSSLDNTQTAVFPESTLPVGTYNIVASTMPIRTYRRARRQPRR